MQIVNIMQTFGKNLQNKMLDDIMRSILGNKRKDNNDNR